MLIVQKYGGSSVGSTERIRRVAERIVATHEEGHDLVVVVSAMGDTTDRLLGLAGELAPVPSRRELDMLLSAGERISNALVAMAVQTLGVPACSFSGPQAGVITSSVHGRARIIGVEPTRVRQALDRGMVVLVAGFQGVSRETGEDTTLGRGGSDTTAIALAAALKADVCEIYTDVDGVHTADPHLVPQARPLSRLDYDTMLELAASGAKVLAPRSVEYARRHGVTVRVRASDGGCPGTVVSARPDEPERGACAEHAACPERAPFAGVAHDLSTAEVTVTAVPARQGAVSTVFRVVADAGAEIDTVVQPTVYGPGARAGDIRFVLPKSDVPAVLAALCEHRAEIGHEDVICRDDIGKVSLVGSGIRTRTGAIATFCETLARADVRFETVSATETRISVLCPAARLPDALRALHRSFGLGADAEPAKRVVPSGRAARAACAGAEPARAGVCR
ncbi:aspartate kinase [Streptomyces sp. UNOB3_S3]|uniref:aspartate kinase n=1 Tax=Streptomyces sp. UNOB3_S3 TaxID=2871682 RepID=UPI001E5B708A|nr:aspartate kinase [Streptomyces sp. UNOB3_S3]MCC3777388.1 aspartate kinase [Streptomyces sp. UNOB3_S3]